jgi:hypothetical protein
MTTNTNSDFIVADTNGLDSDAITFCSAGVETLKISHKGFWLNGKLVDDTEQNRAAVYESFKSWLVFQRMAQK